MKNYVIDGIMGLVVADAMGVPVEFKSRSELKKNPVRDMIGYGTYNQPAGTWSDDSSMTLCMADSLKHGFQPEDIMNKFLAWMSNGDYTPYQNTFDVGNSTSRAILNYTKGMKPLKCGGKMEYDNGNGSLMRILPMALYQYANKTHFISNNMQGLMEPIHDASKLTHAHNRSLIACGLYSLIVGDLLNDSQNIKESIRRALTNGFNYYGHIVKEEYRNDLPYYEKLRDLDIFAKLEESEIKSSGYVVDTLEAAIWCLLNTNSYEECIIKAVNLGEDTDTVAAVAGGMAGIVYGYKEIPEKWLHQIAKRGWIEFVCLKLQMYLNQIDEFVQDKKDARYLENIKPGTIVRIKQNEPEETFIGYVKRVFTKSAYKQEGVKVSIGNKLGGRVQKVYESELEAMIDYKEEFRIHRKDDFFAGKLWKFEELWHNSPLNKGNYGEYMIYHPFEVEREMERIKDADFDLLGALLTLMFREEHMSGYGGILNRVEAGYFYQILNRVDRMLHEQII